MFGFAKCSLCVLVMQWEINTKVLLADKNTELGRSPVMDDVS